MQVGRGKVPSFPVASGGTRGAHWGHTGGTLGALGKRVPVQATWDLVLRTRESVAVASCSRKSQAQSQSQSVAAGAVAGGRAGGLAGGQAWSGTGRLADTDTVLGVLPRLPLVRCLFLGPVRSCRRLVGVDDKTSSGPPSTFASCAPALSLFSLLHPRAFPSCLTSFSTLSSVDVESTSEDSFDLSTLSTPTPFSPLIVPASLPPTYPPTC